MLARECRVRKQELPMTIWAQYTLVLATGTPKIHQKLFENPRYQFLNPNSRHQHHKVYASGFRDKVLGPLMASDE